MEEAIFFDNLMYMCVQYLENEVVDSLAACVGLLPTLCSRAVS